MSSEYKDDPLSDISFSRPVKKYPTFSRNKRRSNSHHRRSSAPAMKLAVPLRFTTLDNDDINKYEEYIELHCKQLIPICECLSCNNHDHDDDDDHDDHDDDTDNINIPFSSFEYSRSAPSSYSMAADCEETKNLSLIRIIGMGAKNKMPRLLSILNDINSRLLFEQYKKDLDFYNIENIEKIEEIGDIEEEEKKYNDKYNDNDSDDDDIAEIEENDKNIHELFKQNIASLCDLDSISPLRVSRSCSILDSVPLLNSPSIFRFNKAWDILNKMPIHQAIRTYHIRLAPPLTFSPRYFIKDSISHYIGQISLLTVIIQKLVREQGMPFQFDVVILSKDAIRNNKENDKDDQKENNDNHKYHHLYDDIGNNLMQRFLALPEHHSDHFCHFAIGVPPKGSHRKKLGKKLKNVNLLKQTQHGRYVCIIDREGTRTDPLYREEIKEKKEKEEKEINPNLVLKRRTTTKILRLKEEKQEEKKQEKQEKQDDFFYFFQPPKPFGDITHGVAMSESMHMNTLDFLIPALKNEDCNIGARHLCGGKMFCISFHIMSKDEIKCYLYIDQKCMKIELKQQRPITDLMRILPHYFNDNQFQTISVMNKLKEMIKDRKIIKKEMNEFNLYIKNNKFTDDDIENDIFSGYEKSKIIHYLQHKCKWEESKILLLYNELHRLFGFASIPNRNSSTFNINDPNIIENFSIFSTMDNKYNEMIDKLNINNIV